MRIRAWMMTLLVLAGVLTLSAASWAQSGRILGGAGAPPIAEGAGGWHAWAIVPVTGVPEREASVLHLPPRVAVGELPAADPGEAKVATWLSAMPTAAAGWDDRLYLVFAPGEGSSGGRRSHAVLSLRVVPTPARTWVFVPPDRLEVLPEISSSGRVAGMTAGASGPTVLLQDSAGEGREWTLLRLAGLEWEAVALPWESAEGIEPPGSGDQVLLASGDGSVHLVVWSGRAGRRLTLLEPTVGAEVAEGAEAARWVSERIEPSESAIGPIERVLRVDGQTVATTAGESVRLWLLEASGPALLADLGDAGDRWGVVPLPGAGRAALVRVSEETPADGRTAVRRYFVNEVSVYTGQSLFSGELRREGPISTSAFRAVALVLILAMAAVLVFILRSDREVLLLPPGLEAGAPAPRLVAALVDAMPGFAVAGLVHNISPLRLVDPVWIVSAGSDARALLTAVGLTVAYCTVMEWRRGATVGKLAMGCAVIRRPRSAGVKAPPGAGGVGTVESGVPAEEVLLDRPRLWQALARNVVRWTLPPLTFQVMFDPTCRHAGDLLAGTLVVSRVVELPEEPGRGE